MKNFFKKLAFVLALAMIVTAIAPAGKASAAVKPSFKYTKKVLYIGGDMTGAYGDTHKFPINNAAGYTVSWKSSAPSVATVDAKSGTIKAVAVGTSTIAATLTSKAGNATELKATVFVKQNADKVGVGSTKEVSEMSVGEAKKVNVYRQLGATKVWKQADKTLVTDYIKWESSNPSVATVSKWGTVTAVAAGEAVITVSAVQSEGTTVVDKTTFTVKVAAGLTAAKQTGLSTIEAKFAGDLSAVVNKDNVKVYQMEGATEINVIVKSVEFDATDKTKATITVFSQFVKDKDYVVKYTDTKAGFKGADSSDAAVASIAIKTSEVKPNEVKALEFQVFDKDGIDITKPEYVSRIDVAVVGTSADSFLDTTNKTIIFWGKDKTTTVKASYHTYTYNTDYTEKLLTAEKAIVSKEAAGVTVTKAGTATITSAATPDFDKATTSMSVKDQTSKIYVKTTNSDGKDVYSKDNTAFKFEQTDKTTLIVTETGELFPVKEGSSQIIVKYNNVFLTAVTVTIGGERKPATVETTWAAAKSSLSKGVAADTTKLTVETKDQYGSANNTQVKVEYVTGPADATKFVPIVAASVAGKVDISFAGNNFDKVGTFQYKITVDKQVRYVYVTVGDAENKPLTHTFSNSGKTVDTAFKFYDGTDATKTDDKKFTMDLNSYAANGYMVAKETVYAASGLAFGNLVPAATGKAIYVEVIDKDGNVVALDGTNKFISFAASTITVQPIATSAAGVLVKLPSGTYSVRAYEISNPDGKVLGNDIIKMIAMTSFTVVDTQVQATRTINKDTSALTVQTVLSNEDVVTIKIGDTVVNSKEVGKNLIKANSTNSLGSGLTKAITTATVNLPIFYKDTVAEAQEIFEQEVTVGVTVTFAN